MTDFRWDPLRRCWALHASHRGQCRDDLQPASETTADCPFCPGNESLTPQEIYSEPGKSDKGWQLRVIPSPRPMVSVGHTWSNHRDGIYSRIAAVGAHEILIDCPDHETRLDQLSIDHLVLWLKTVRGRFLDLRGDFRLRHFTLVKNQGTTAGARLTHSHTHLLGLAVPTPEMRTRLEACRTYFRQHERCLQCDILAQERENKERIVLDDGTFILLAPFASRFPFELSLLPLNHQHDFTALTDSQLPSLAAILKQAIGRLNLALENPDWQLILHTAPPPHTRPGRPDYWHSLAWDSHWQFTLIPRLAPPDGLATVLGGWVNPVAPEEAAGCLREMQYNPAEIS